MEKPVIQVQSEIGTLRSVLLKRPGAELENITPDTMHRLLFDDVPDLRLAQAEHDDFAETLRGQGVTTRYADQLLRETLTAQPGLVDRLLADVLHERRIFEPILFEAVLGYLKSLSVADLVDALYAGVRMRDLDLPVASLTSLVQAAQPNPFVLDPLPNAYFTRDPQASLGHGMTINHMTFPARQVETIFAELIFSEHPDFAGRVPFWTPRTQAYHLEGGDELMLNEQVVAVGLSERTEAGAIEQLATTLFAAESEAVDTVVAIEIPHNHAMMHLDTVFTMINHDQFTMHPGILDHRGELTIYVLRKQADGTVEIEQARDLVRVLKDVLNLAEVDLILTGAGDPVVAPREQWNDGSNTLAIAPGVVVTYDRNHVSNELLREHGIIVHEVRSSELSRGRGGPRCMSQPLWRDLI